LGRRNAYNLDSRRDGQWLGSGLDGLWSYFRWTIRDGWGLRRHRGGHRHLLGGNAKPFLLAIWLVSVSASPGLSASLEVAPTTIALNAKLDRGSLSISNRGQTLTAVEVNAFEWTQPDGRDELTDTHILQLSPPIATLEPGVHQTVRFRLASKAGAPRERAYRVIVTELPIQEASETPQIAVLLRFSLPVFDVPEGALPGVAEWTARMAGQDLVIRGNNSGGRHLKFAHLDVTAASGAKPALVSNGLTYILAGGTMEYRVPAQGLSAGTGLNIATRTEGDDVLSEVHIVIGP
jgi:fimbrial chaperone protein